MVVSRSGESPDSSFFRSNRIYAADSLWWFDTREGVQFGPFLCRNTAMCALAVFVAQHVHEGKNTRKRTSGVPGSQDRIAHMIEEILEVLRQNRDFGEMASTNWVRSRLEELRRTRSLTAETAGRIQVLEFSLQHPEQTFDFEYFLKCRAG
jgi:hypothetical protein